MQQPASKVLGSLHLDGMGPAVVRMVEQRIRAKNGKELPAAIEDIAGLAERTLPDGHGYQLSIACRPKLRRIKSRYFSLDACTISRPSRAPKLAPR